MFWDLIIFFSLFIVILKFQYSFTSRDEGMIFAQLYLDV